jgi:subtilisin family serine protease
VAGIVLARANNGAGIVGMCPQCTLVPIKMLGEGMGGGISVDIAAFEHAIAADVAVINNSWGFTEPTPVPDLLADVIHRAATEPRGGLGALVVFAAGNDDRELGNDEMEALPEVLCVSASDSYGRPTNYTNYGDSVALAAPSATVSIAPGGGTTTTFGGTSAAAPVASGLAAWAFSVKPDFAAAELRQLLIDTAVPSPLVVPDENGHDPYYGYGELSALKLWEALFPADEDSGKEEAQACGCHQGAAPGAFSLLVGLIALGRRRRVTE